MKDTLPLPADSIEQAVNTYENMLLRIYLVMLANEAEAVDAVWETALKYPQWS